MRWTRWSVLVAFVALAGCATPASTPGTSPTTPGPQATEQPDPGQPGTDQPDPGQPGTDQPGVELTITLDESGSGSVRTFTLTCDPPGGDHPDPDAACHAFVDAWPEMFEPVPRDVACTEQWGGPQVATVQGTVDGERVDAHFDRTNGCEISRWDALAPLLGSPGGA